MAKKKVPADARIELRLPKSEKDAFERQAKEDSISTVSQWLLWLARNRVKESRPK